MKVLVVDDSSTMRKLVTRTLTETTYKPTKVTEAVDGVDAWEKFCDGDYDLVLCDMLMPQMIGLEVLRRIKGLKPDQRFILLTSVKEESMMKKAQELGCSIYLNKPIRLVDLEAKVEECFPKS